MSMINENIRFNNQDIIIKFGLTSNNKVLGDNQEIDNLSAITSDDLINPSIDQEVIRFKHYDNIELRFDFINATPINLGFYDAGFTYDEIYQNDLSYSNSFFILDFFDTYNSNTQTKILTTYLTKLGTGFTATYNLGNGTINQFNDLYVPQSFIDSQSGTTITGYTKFSFYNAKSGKSGIVLFYNSDILESIPEKMYFKTELDVINKTFKFLTIDPTILNAKQLSTSIKYIDKINKTFDKFENKKQIYPSGSTFINNATYVVN